MSFAVKFLAALFLHLVSDCLMAGRTHSVLQHAHCAAAEALPASDAIRGSAELGPKGSEFIRWLWGPAGNRQYPSFMCGLI